MAVSAAAKSQKAKSAAIAIVGASEVPTDIKVRLKPTPSIGFLPVTKTMELLCDAGGLVYIFINNSSGFQHKHCCQQPLSISCDRWVAEHNVALPNLAQVAEKVTLGLLTGAYEATRFKNKPTKATLQSVELLGLGAGEGVEAAIARGAGLAKGVTLAKCALQLRALCDILAICNW